MGPDGCARDGTDRPPLAGCLTAREIEAIRLLGERLMNQEIAEILAVSVLTVKKHTANIDDRLDAPGSREAVARARSLGLISWV